MDELKPCQFCGTEDEDNETSRRKFFTPILKGIDYVGIAYEKATRKFYLHAESEDLDYSEDCEITACPVCGRPLNRRPALENKPLTLDQLRQMDGEPVWISEQKNGGRDSREQWQQFAYEEPKYNLMAFWEFGDERENTYDIADYGKTWLAYARKPEQEG